MWPHYHALQPPTQCNLHTKLGMYPKMHHQTLWQVACSNCALVLNSSSIQITLKVWLDKYWSQTEGQPEESQDTTMTKNRLEHLDKLERELKPVEWLAQCVWQQAGKDGRFDSICPTVPPLYTSHQKF